MKIKMFNDKYSDLKDPKKSHLPDVGLDLFVPESFTIDSLETKTIGLGIGIAVPEGFAGMLVPRSSISELGLIIQTAVIDPDYTGEIHLIITNCSKNSITIEKNQRVCSLVIYSVLNARVEKVIQFETTERGDNCLGSTGI